MPYTCENAIYKPIHINISGLRYNSPIFPYFLADFADYSRDLYRAWSQPLFGKKIEKGFISTFGI